MAKTQTVCMYCDTPNPQDYGNCLACGAPIEVPAPEPFQKPKTTKTKAKPEQRPEEQLKKIGEKADDAYFTVMNTYAIAWRTIGEAVAIAISSFILGFVGGATEMWYAGIIFATLLGVVIGLTRKNFYFVLASAPIGTLIGMGVGVIPWVLGAGPKLMIFSAGIFAILAAVVGGRRNLPFGRRNWWEKARPFLGGLGGFGFGFLGMLLGWGLITTIEAFMKEL